MRKPKAERKDTRVRWEPWHTLDAFVPVPLAKQVCRDCGRLGCLVPVPHGAAE